MNQIVTVDAVLEMTKQLSTVDKVRLIERMAPQITRDLNTVRKQPPKSLRGLWHGSHISSEDIEQMRRDMWKNFPREDI